MNISFTCLVKSKPVKHEVSRAAIVPPMVGVLSTGNGRLAQMWVKRVVSGCSPQSKSSPHDPWVELMNIVTFQKPCSEFQQLISFSLR